MDLLAMLEMICISGPFAEYSWLIISIFAFSVILLFTGTWRIFKGIDQGNSFLKGFSGEGDASRPENFMELNQFFRKNKDLSHAWNEFYECVVAETEEIEINGKVQNRKVYKNSRPAEEFFEFEEIVYNSPNWFLGVKFGVFDSIPNILTGLGILGTFYGIITGLPGSISEESYVMMETISVFLGAMKIAFGTSLLGLSLGLIFNLFERVAHDKLEQKINKLAFRIDYLFKRKTEQDYLYRLVQHMESMNNSLLDMPTKMSDSIAEGFSKMGIETDDVASNIKAGVQAGFEQLGNQIETTLEAQNQINEMTKKVMEEIREVTQTVSQTSEMLQKNQMSTENITNSLTELDDSLNKLSSDIVPKVMEAVDANKGIQEAIYSVTEAVTLGQEANRNLREEFKELANNVHTTNESFVEAYNGFQDKLVESIRSNLGSFDSELANSVTRLSQVVGDIGSVGDDIVVIHNGIRDKVSKLLDKESPEA